MGVLLVLNIIYGILGLFLICVLVAALYKYLTRR